MNNINKLNAKNNDDIFVDDDGIEWKKVCSRDYVLMTDDEPLVGTATLFSTGEHGWFKYVDVEHGIEADRHWSKRTAKIYFEENLEIHLEGKIYWAR